MNKVLIALALVTLMWSCSNKSQSVVEKTAHVYGNCEKCKAVIEKAAGSVQGLSLADWNTESKLLKIKIDTTVASMDAVLKAIAAAGYDNESYMGNDYEYQKLPECCHYERKEH